VAGVQLSAAEPNLNWQDGPGYRWKEVSVPANGRTGFTRLSAEITGMTFTNVLSDPAVARNRILEIGSGVALGDVDGDGRSDVYFCRLEGPNVLYRNLGDWKFADITESAGVACPNQFSTGAALADIDGDGDLDLLVNSIGGGTRAFLNDGRAHFTEIVDSRLVRRFGSTSLALADVDGDGDLDLYVTNYRTDTHKDSPPGLRTEVRLVEGRIEVTPADRFFALGRRGSAAEVVERGERDFFYLNDGRGRFAPVSWTAGSFFDEDGKPTSGPPLDWGLSVMFRDINGDGLPDIYVCNDFFFSPDRIWINEDGLRFRAIPRTAVRSISASSMAVDFADLNRDGFDDFIVVEMLGRDHRERATHRENVIHADWNLPVADINHRMEVPRNTLGLNRGDGTFAEIAQYSHLQATDWSWGVAFLDIDLDGYEDLLVATGSNHDVQDTDRLREFASSGAPRTPEVRLSQLGRLKRLDAPNLAFRNNHNLVFTEVSREWGFDDRAVSQGMAFGDLDNDADLDVVMNNMNGEAGVYRNDGGGARTAVRLRGEGGNTRGIGAKIRVFGGAAPVQSQEMICGGRYLSSDDSVRVFAAGDATNEMRIEVSWRSGRTTTVNGVKGNRVYEIDEKGAGAARAEREKRRVTVFEDRSGAIRHRHVENVFADFARQSLLPRKLSQLGPGVAWYDADGDGRDDLIVGSGKGGKVSVHVNDGKGGFKLKEEGSAVSADQSGVLGWTAGTNRLILAGLSNYEEGTTNGGCLSIYNLNRGVVEESVPGQAFSVGPLALADVDGDGDLDLFVGGRVNPGRYPEPADSLILRNDAGSLVPGQRLEKVGLVSGAVFSDLDGDGKPELVLACEWGPVRVFRNELGRFKEVTEELGLEKHRGWWNGVTTGDFDGDGRMDIVASNWGRNTPYESHRERELKLYYGDLAGTGELGMIEAYHATETGKEVPERTLEIMERSMPWVREKFPTHAAYGAAGVDEILGERRKSVAVLSAGWLETTVFMNRGDRLEAVVLPAEAQMAPAFAVCVGDYDGDGREDIFLSQNFFGVRPEDGRYDAGRGLWLQGNGRGGFRSVTGQESGVMVYGEQRGAALCDYDGDGRVDLAVTQNGAETKLYRNAGGQAGLRVSLNGGSGNPQGAGARMRLKFGERWGATREIHAGSGYWSQDSPVQVLGTPDPPTQIQIRWPGGSTTTGSIPPGAREIVVGGSGSVRAVR